MRPDRWTVASFVLTEVLALSHLWLLLSGHFEGYLALLSGACVLIAVPAAAIMLRRSCFECQVVASILAMGSGLAALLSCTVGLPGHRAHPVFVEDVLLLVLAVVLPLLTVQSVRRAQGSTRRSAP